MPVKIACPKCKTQYQLPDSALGKAVKCKNCGTAFKTKAPSNNQQLTVAKKRELAVSQPSQSELARFGIDGPIKKQADIFAAPPLNPKHNPLGSYIDDPGFGTADAFEDELEIEDDGDDGMAAILNNPYATTSGSTKTKKKKKSWGEGDPNYDYKPLGVWAVLSAIGVAIEASLWVVIPLFLIFLAMGADAPEAAEAADEIDEEALAGIFAVFAALGIFLLVWLINNLFLAISFFVYSYRANANLRALGAKGLKTTPGMTIGWWFVPFMNWYKPIQAMNEIVKASERPRGKSWTKLKDPGKFNWGWTLYGFAFAPLGIVILFGIESQIILNILATIGIVSHVVGAIMLIMVLFDVSRKQNEHALDKYGEV